MSGSAAHGAERIAIPFSDLASGERAVAAVLRDPRAGEAEVELIALVDPWRPGKVAVFVSRARAERDARAAAERWLDILAPLLAVRGIIARRRVVLGPIGAALRRLGARADLTRIVVAAPARRWWHGNAPPLALHAAVRPVTFVP